MRTRLFKLFTAVALLSAAGCILNAKYQGRPYKIAYTGDDWQTLQLRYDTVPISVKGSDIPGIQGTVEIGGLTAPNETLEGLDSITAELQNENGTVKLHLETTSSNERLTVGAIELEARRTGNLDLYSSDGEIEVTDMLGEVKVGSDIAKVLVRQKKPDDGSLPGAVTFETEIGDLEIDTLGKLSTRSDLSTTRGTVGAGGIIFNKRYGGAFLTLPNDTFDQLDISVFPELRPDQYDLVPDNMTEYEGIELIVPKGSGFEADISVTYAGYCIKVGDTDESGTNSVIQGPINGGGTGATIKIKAATPISIHEPGVACVPPRKIPQEGSGGSGGAGGSDGSGGAAGSGGSGDPGAAGSAGEASAGSGGSE